MIYLNYAALSPTNVEAEREVLQTLEEFKQYLYSDAGIQWYLTKSMECRRTVSQVLNVNDPVSIAFVPNASTANHLALNFLDWQPGDIILTSTHENPSIMLGLQRIASKGVHIHTIVPTMPSEFIDRFEQAIRNPRVKAIVLSHVPPATPKIEFPCIFSI